MHGERHRLGVRGDQHAHPDSLAAPEDSAAGQEEHQRQDRVLKIRCALQDPAALAQDFDEFAPFPPGREGGRQRAGPETFAVEFVDGRVHPGHAEQPGVQRLVEQRRHLFQLVVGGPNRRVGGPFQSEHRGAQVRMTKQRTDIGAQRQGVDRLDVFRRRRPRPARTQRAEDVFARNRLHSAEQIGGVLGIGIDGRQRAVAQQHGGDTVAHRLAQAGVQQHFGVVVGVHVEEAGHDPFAGRLDHLGATGLVQRLGRDGDHDTVADAQCAGERRGAGAVEPQSVANDHVVGHGVLPVIVAER